MATPPQGARTKAAKLRKQLASGEISDIDRLWLDDYTEKTNGSGDWGKSASRTRVHRSETIEEDKAAEGTGTAAAHAAGLALMTKEEGRRLDSLTINSIAALKEAVDVYKSVCVSLLEQNKAYGAAHVEMLNAYRGEMLSRIDAEGDLREKENEKEPDPSTAMIMAVVAQHLGIDLSQAAKAPPKNGAAKKSA